MSDHDLILLGVGLQLLLWGANVSLLLAIKKDTKRRLSELQARKTHIRL